MSGSIPCIDTGTVGTAGDVYNSLIRQSSDKKYTSETLERVFCV